MKLTATKKGAETKEATAKETRSRRGRTSRAKGATFERDVAKIFAKQYGIELVRTPLSGGFAKHKDSSEGFKGDIVPVDKNVNLLLHIECKNAVTWSLPAWFKQSEEDCPEDKNPCVIFHKNGTSKNYIALPLESFLALVPKDSIVEGAGK